MKFKKMLLILCILVFIFILAYYAYEKAIPAKEADGSEAVIEDISEVQPEEEIQEVKDITINTLRNSFDKDNLVIPQDTTIYWNNTDERDHRVICSISKDIMFESDQLKPGDNASFRFSQMGYYMCQDAVLGYWCNIRVTSGN